MSTTTQTKVAADLNEFAQLLKDNGFTVLVSKKHSNPIGWMTFFKDGSFGHVSKERISGYHFSTVHKPCKECGTGYRMSDDFADLTIDNAIESLAFAPNWAAASDRKAIRKYKDVDDFINSTHNKWAEYYAI